MSTGIRNPVAKQKGARLYAGNVVAKHARKFNKSAVMTDRKRAAKRGYTKHRGDRHGH